MKIEVGKFYTARDGSQVQVVATLNDDPYPFLVEVIRTGRTFSVCENGQRYPSASDDLDIVDYWTEADEIQPEDLEAAADKYDEIVKAISPACQIIRLAKERHGIDLLPSRFIDKAISIYACGHDLSESVELVAQEFKSTPKRKPFKIMVKLECYYEIPADTLPPYATDTGVEHLVEDALGDLNRSMTLEDFTAKGFLGLDPVEVAIGHVLAQ